MRGDIIQLRPYKAHLKKKCHTCSATCPPVHLSVSWAPAWPLQFVSGIQLLLGGGGVRNKNTQQRSETNLAAFKNKTKFSVLFSAAQKTHHFLCFFFKLFLPFFSMWLNQAVFCQQLCLYLIADSKCLINWSPPNLCPSLKADFSHQMHEEVWDILDGAPAFRSTQVPGFLPPTAFVITPVTSWQSPGWYCRDLQIPACPSAKPVLVFAK